jgi:hypothetical protein
LGAGRSMLERDQDCRVGREPFWSLGCMKLWNKEHHVRGSIVMKKPAVSCQRLGRLHQFSWTG